MKAMILAAGLGTRLRPLTNSIPKPMVPLLGIPNIQRIICHLRDQGIEDFAINLHYCPLPIRNHLKNGSQLNVSIEYFNEPNILGTGGGIRNMLPHMGNDTFVVCNGDVLFMPDVKALLKHHKKSGALASMVVRRTEHAEALGAVGMDSTGKVKRLVWAGDKTIENLFMFTGMHIIEPQIERLLPQEGCIVRKTYIPMVEQNDSLYAIESNAYFCDLGTPVDYLDANLKIARGELQLPGFTAAAHHNVFGSDIQIAPQAQVENCILADGVVVKKGVKIQESIVMADAVVTRNATRKIILSDGTEMDAS